MKSFGLSTSVNLFVFAVLCLIQISSSLDEESWQQADNEPGDDDSLCPLHPSCWANVVKNPAVTAAILSAISQQQQRELRQLSQLQQQQHYAAPSAPVAGLMYRQTRSEGAMKDKYHSLFDRFSKKSRFGSAVRLTRK